MSVSAAFTANAQAASAIEDWYHDTIESNAYLDELFKHEFPDWWESFSTAQKAARWTKHEIGAHNTKAVVYKKHSTDHIDTGDIGPTMIFVLPNLDQGGYLDLVDLETRLYYGPGSVVIGWFGYLWHFVTESRSRCIEPLQEFKDAHLTPGRISIVSYFPETSYAQLKNKPEGWGRATMWGRVDKGDDDSGKMTPRKKQKVKH